MFKNKVPTHNIFYKNKVYKNMRLKIAKYLEQFKNMAEL